jgi:DNA repair protein RecN (Recombination protein N)
MLSFLSIRDYALIEALDIEFKSGLNIITGETGAGKSIIIEALSLLLGGRVKGEAVRTGKDGAVVQGTFSLAGSGQIEQALADMGVDLEDHDLTLRREINRDGRHRCFINGMKFPLGTLRQTGDLLVDVHGQNEHQSLMRVTTHLDFLDDFSANTKILQDYKKLYKDYVNKKNTLASLLQKEQELIEKKDFLEFQAKELNSADLYTGKEDALLSKIKFAEGAHRTSALMEEIVTGLRDNVSGPLQSLRRRIQELAKIDRQYEQTAQELEAVGYRINEIQDGLSSRQGREEAAQIDIDDLNKKLASINRLKRKYRRDEKALIDLLESTQRDLNLLENVDADKETLQKAVQAAQERIERCGHRLSGLRRKSAQEFDRKINQFLVSINMADAGFLARIDKKDQCDATGFDNVEFVITINPGEPARPLARIASGGEISRVMLAVKSILADRDRLPVLIFDEVDAGIGGETAVKIGTALKGLAKHHQVFCITHLHQIAKQAAHHYNVEKRMVRGKTRISIRALNEEEKIEEMTRMLGDIKSRKGRDHARSLVRRAV